MKIISVKYCDILCSAAARLTIIIFFILLLAAVPIPSVAATPNSAQLASILSVLQNLLSQLQESFQRAKAQTTGLVGHWTFDEGSGTTAGDSAGSNTGTLVNGPTWTTGKIGQALNFDGSNDYVNFGSASGLDNLSSLTASAWVYVRTSNSGSIITKRLLNGSAGWGFSLDSTNAMRLHIDYATTDLVRKTSNNILSPNTWHHVLVTWDGSTNASNVHIYIDGAETSYQTTTNGADARGDDNTAIGNIGSVANGSTLFNGSIDDVRIYNRVLSPAEVQSLYNQSSPPSPLPPLPPPPPTPPTPTPPPPPVLTPPLPTPPGPSVRDFYVDADIGLDTNPGTLILPWKTLARAYSSMAPGNTIFLAGIFTNQILDINERTGTVALPITIRPTYGRIASIVGGAYGTGIKLRLSSYVVLDGLEVSGTTVAVFATKSHHLTFRSLIVQDNISTCIMLERTDDSVIENTIVRRCGNPTGNMGEGIQISNGSRNRIVGNNVGDAGHTGIVVLGTPIYGEVDTNDTVIADNAITNTWATGVSMTGYRVNHTIIERNRITGSGSSGLMGCPVGGCALGAFHKVSPGLHFQSNAGIIRQNVITNSSGDGIMIGAYPFGSIHQEPSGNQVYNNTVYGNGGTGLFIFEQWGHKATSNIITQNIFYKNGGYIAEGWKGPRFSVLIEQYHNTHDMVWPIGSLGTNQIKNNVILRNTSAAGEQAVGHIRVGTMVPPVLMYTVAQFNDTFQDADGNIELDPLFVNTTVGDFHLLPESPAIDKGRIIAGINYAGAAPDIGAFEYDSGAPSDSTPPSTLTNLSASAVSSSQINLSWTASTDNVAVIGYRIYRGGTQIGTSNTTSYQNTGLTANTTYSYTVAAYDAAGNVSGQSVSSSATTQTGSVATTPTPVVPTPTTGGDGGGGSSFTPSTSVSTGSLLPPNFNSLTQAQKIVVLTAKIAELQTLINNLLSQARQPVSASSCIFTRNLFLGLVGEDVKCLQKYLNSSGFTVSTFGLGSSGNESNYFGSRTMSAVLRWQQAYNVAPSAGYFGPKSRAKYLELYR